MNVETHRCHSRIFEPGHFEHRPMITNGKCSFLLLVGDTLFSSVKRNGFSQSYHAMTTPYGALIYHTVIVRGTKKNWAGSFIFNLTLSSDVQALKLLRQQTEVEFVFLNGNDGLVHREVFQQAEIQRLELCEFSAFAAQHNNILSNLDFGLALQHAQTKNMGERIIKSLQDDRWASNPHYLIDLI